MSRHTITRPTVVALAISLSMLGACGRGGPSVTLPSGPNESASSGVDACAPGGERTLEGRYAGTITYDATSRGGAMCAWDARVSVRATSIAGGYCALSMTLDAAAEQLVVPADGAPFAGACIDSVGVSAELSLDGLTLAVSAAADAPEVTTYPGTSGPLVRSISLVSTLVPLVDALAIDPASGALAPVRLRQINGESLTGQLVRAPD